MRKNVLAMLLCVAAVGLAAEQVYVPGTMLPGSGGRASTHPQFMPRATSEPVWARLQGMDLADRQNSDISIVLESGASPDARLMATKIEGLWNGGGYDEALALFPQLAQLTDANRMAIGSRLREPRVSGGEHDWGTDVRIGSYDSVYHVSLDVDRSNGNLIAFLQFTGYGYQSNLNTFISYDGGAHWNETFNWWSSYYQAGFSAAIVNGYDYAAFIRNDEQNEIMVLKFSTADGSTANFISGAYYHTFFTVASPESIREVVATANQETYNNRFYITTLHNTGAVEFRWVNVLNDDTTANVIPTGITNASIGLDACFNTHSDSLYFFASYYDNSGNICVGAVTHSDAWTSCFSAPTGMTGNWLTSGMGAYQDTIIVVFEFQGSSAYYCQYFTNYTAGSGTWYWANVGNDTLVTAECPDVASRNDGGEGIVYRYYTDPRELRYVWRFYGGGWSTPVAVADHEPWYNKPCIEYIYTGAYGVVYTDWQTYGAWFDRSDWTTGLAERPGNRVITGSLRVLPSPARGDARVSYSVRKAGAVSVRLYDRAGRQVRTLFSGTQPPGEYSLDLAGPGLVPGSYFVRADLPQGGTTAPVTIVR